MSDSQIVEEMLLKVMNELRDELQKYLAPTHFVMKTLFPERENPGKNLEMEVILRMSVDFATSIEHLLHSTQLKQEKEKEIISKILKKYFAQLREFNISTQTNLAKNAQKHQT
jgi:hypothetical protein